MRAPGIRCKVPHRRGWSLCRVHLDECEVMGLLLALIVGWMTFRCRVVQGQDRVMQLRELRLARGWSQEQLAERSGLSVRTVQRIENGQAPGLASRAALADAFGLTLDELVADEAPAESASTTVARAPAPTTASFVDAIRMCLTKYADFHGRAS